jgi:hypothetical protein
MKPKFKKPEPKPQPAVTAWCPKCSQKRYSVNGQCLVCNGKVQA